MNRTTALAGVFIALLLVLVLAGCGEPARGVTDSGRLQAQWVDLPDGRVVVCVSGGRWAARSLDCDWNTAAREGEPSDPSGDYEQED